MLKEEEMSANLELVPEMSVEGVLPLNSEGVGNLGHVDANVVVAIRSAIWYKILFGVLGGILALAVLLKIIGACRRMHNENKCGYLTTYVNTISKPKRFFIAFKGRSFNIKYNDEEYYEEYAYHSVAVTTLGDIIGGDINVNNKIARLFKTEKNILYK